MPAQADDYEGDDDDIIEGRPDCVSQTSITLSYVLSLIAVRAVFPLLALKYIRDEVFWISQFSCFACYFIHELYDFKSFEILFSVL